MTTSQENFAVSITEKTHSHDEWLAIVRFGLGTLLESQNVLAEILFNEAVREAAKIPTHKPADEIAKILRELGLTISCPNADLRQDADSERGT